MNKDEMSMNYGDLFLIDAKDSIVIGTFICYRPNGNIIYDRYYISENYDLTNDYKRIYRYSIEKTNSIGEVKKDSNKKYQFIDIDKAGEFFEEKIEKLKSNFRLIEIDKKIIDELKNEIANINKEIDNTRTRPIDKSLSKEEIEKIWNNKNKAIQQKQKGARRLERKLETIKIKIDNENKKLKENYDRDLKKFEESKKCITNFIKIYNEK